ncbi:MAG: diadenylate cyclase CdaA [Anaerovoracaceae bacterium]|jgi:diadenylate cyclase|nr:diadenylate cyclase CdaA [Anaerovoracaceae bacterium]
MPELLSNIGANIQISDVLDIAIVTFVIYKIMEFIKETRAQQLVKGLLVLVLATFISGEFQLYTLNWVLKGVMTIGVIALVIIFQPELRRGLEYVGRQKLLKSPIREIGKEKAKHIANQLVKTVNTFSAQRIGALIVFEREVALKEICDTGTLIKADISSELLGNIFYEGSPLHDGAVIVRGDRIYAAGCVLPLTQNKDLSKDLGTRHRAGLGITEHSDAMALIVSEETGIISIAVDGKLSRFLDVKSVEKELLNFYLGGFDEKIPAFFGKLRKKKNVPK